MSYLNPDIPDGYRLTVVRINQAPHTTLQTAPVGQPQPSHASISWTANRLSVAQSGNRPLDPPHRVFLNWTQHRLFAR